MTTSTFKFSTGLGGQLALTPTKLDWATKLKTILGNTRRLRCYHDPAGGADPVVSGTEFLNIGSSGDFAVTSGNITSLGLLSGFLVNLAKDLSTGTAALRMEGNGEWFQASLGLIGSGKDYLLPSNPTGAPNVGFAFVSGAGAKAPRLMPSGTGPVAPPIRSVTPTVVKLWDCANESSPVLVGTARFLEANRQDDWVYQNAGMASETGDVAIYELDDTIKWTSPIAPRRFELGGLLMIASNYNTENGVMPLEQMLLSFAPYQRWATYPYMDTFIRAQYPLISAATWPYTYGDCSNADVADRTVLPPFKVTLELADGTVVFTHEWKAFNDKPTVAINSPLLSEVQTLTEPAMPRFNCAQMLPWQNMRTRLSSKIGKWMPGVESYAYDHPVFGAKAGGSANAFFPMTNSSDTQLDSQAHWFVLPPYPLKNDQALDDTYLTAYEARPRDPTMFTNRDHYPWYRAMGYKYRAGSVSGHDWITGMGGVRFDRATSPTVLTILASNPNWQRPEGLVPIRDMAEEWAMAYFNHSNHWIRDVKTFDSLPKADILQGKAFFVSSYYGNEYAYAPLGQPGGPQITIDTCGMVNGKARWKIHNDPEGFMYYSGWNRDALHSYCNAGLWAIMANSPMHAIAARHDFETQWLSSLGEAAPTASPIGYYNQRIHAWRLLAYVVAWKLATEHRLGFSKEEIESRMQIELELMYDMIYKPAFVDNDQSFNSVAIRNLGTLITASGNNYQSAGGSLGLYVVHTLVLMRQFGLFAAMRARSYKCRDALDMMIRNLDKFVIDYVMDTDMRDCYYPAAITGKTAGQYTPADVPADWAAQKVMLDTYMPPADPSLTRQQTKDMGTPFRFKSFFIAYDGRAEEHFGCPHLYMQYLKARRDYFPDYPQTRLQAAIDKMQGYYDDYLVKRNAGLAYQMAYLHPGHGPLLPPTELGPK
jgi:hypothetical protein